MCGAVTIFMPAGSVSRGASQLQLAPVLLVCAHRCFFALFLKRDPADVSLVKKKKKKSICAGRSFWPNSQPSLGKLVLVLLWCRSAPKGGWRA